MQSTSELTPTETLIENAERHRRWLRRACWAGVAFVGVAILFVAGYPLYARWQLRRQGWALNRASSLRELPVWVPHWADPWFDRIDSADFKQSSLQARDLDLLRRFPKLNTIVLNSTDISEPAFESLSQLSELERIVIRSARFDAAGLRHLAALPRLEQLHFDLALDETALKTVATFPQLRSLGLTGVTDENLRHFSRFHRLAHLQLLKSHVTDDGAKLLVDNCPSLSTLSIEGGPMTDVGLAELARYPNLLVLLLDDMTISDEGILKLKSCRLLKIVCVRKTKVTSAGATELRKSLPTLDVRIQ